MNVAIFAPYALWTHHFATDLEIAQRHLDTGDEVTILTCQGQMPTCDINTEHANFACVRCRGTQEVGIKLLSRPVRQLPFYNLSAKDQRDLETLKTDFADLRELRQYRVAGFDLGMAALSSLVSIRRDPEVDLVENAVLLRKFLRTAWIVYRSFVNYLESHPTDRVYTFNTRFAPLRGVQRACETSGVECHIHERGHDRNHYAIYPNTFPHDHDYIQQQVRQSWNAAADDPQREQTAKKWFEDRSRGVAQSWLSFTAHQQAQQLPANWNPDKRNVVVFTSSEDEFVAISDDCENPVYRSQLEGMQQLVNSLKEVDHNLHLYLRIHPNLANVENRQTREMHALEADFLTVIGAKEETSTYALMQAAEKVVTFRSTAGIEAVYWGTPSVLVGPSFYVDLGGTYNASSHEELMQLIQATLEPKDREPALMYGHYYATFGNRFRHFAPREFFDGRFKGQKLQPDLADRCKAWLLKRPHSLRKRLAVLAHRFGASSKSPPESRAA